MNLLILLLSLSAYADEAATSAASDANPPSSGSQAAQGALDAPGNNAVGQSAVSSGPSLNIGGAGSSVPAGGYNRPSTIGGGAPSSVPH